MQDQIRPGLFSVFAAADFERANFDARNQQLLESRKVPDILFIGDSITQYWDVEHFFGLQDRLIVNRGIGGDVPENVLRRFDADCIQLHPRLCICTCGINMAHDLLGPCDLQRSCQEVTDRMVCDLKEIVEKAQSADIQIALGSITPTYCPSDPCEAIRKLMTPMANQKIRQLCSDSGVLYLDYYSALVDPNGSDMVPAYTRDGIHPSPQGYQQMKQVLLQALGDVFKET